MVLLLLPGSKNLDVVPPVCTNRYRYAKQTRFILIVNILFGIPLQI